MWDSLEQIRNCEQGAEEGVKYRCVSRLYLCLARGMFPTIKLFGRYGVLLFMLSSYGPCHKRTSAAVNLVLNTGRCRAGGVFPTIKLLWSICCLNIAVVSYEAPFTKEHLPEVSGTCHRPLENRRIAVFLVVAGFVGNMTKAISALSHAWGTSFVARRGS